MHLKVTLSIWLLLAAPAVAAAQARPAPRRQAQGDVEAAGRLIELAAVELPMRGLAFAVSPNSGALALINPDRPAVMVLPDVSAKGSAELAVEVKVGDTPAGLVHKQLGDRGYFLALCARDRTLYMIDDVKFTVVDKVTLAKSMPSWLVAASDPASPYAYYVGVSAEREPVFHDEAVCRIDLRNKKDDGQVMLGNSSWDVSEVACSADGTMLYGRRPNTSPTGVYAFRIPTDEKRPIVGAPIAAMHQSAQPFQPDPFGQYVASGKLLFKYDLERVAELPAAPLCFLPDRPVFLGLDQQGENLHAFSYNTLKTLDVVGLPGWRWGRDGGAGRGNAQGRAAMRQRFDNDRWAPVGKPRRMFQTAIMYDRLNGNIIVCQDTAAAVVPLKVLSLPEEVFLRATVEGKTSLNVGEGMTLKLARKDPKVRVALGPAPAGVKLSPGGDELTWTPGDDQIGAHTVHLNLSGGGQERVQEISLVVRRRSIDMGFVPADVAVSPDGKLAVALERFADPQTRNRADQRIVPGSRVAVVDLERLAVVAVRTLPTNVHEVAIDARHVYAGMTESDAFYVLSSKDLSEVKRVFTKGRVTALVPVADKFIFAASDRGPAAAFRLPEVAPADAEHPALPDHLRHLDSDGRGGPRPASGGWFHFGALYSHDMSTVRLIVAPLGIPQVALAADGKGFFQDPFGREGMPATTWGVQAHQHLVRRVSGENVGTVHALATTVLDDLPAVAAIPKPQQEALAADGKTPRERFQLVLHDLVTTAAVETITLSDEPPRYGRIYDDARGGRIIASRGQVIAQVRQHLFVIPTKGLGGKLPEPLHFVLPTGPEDAMPVVLEPPRPAVINLRAAGGKGPIQYSLAAESPAISVDKSTGRVTVEPAPFIDKAIELLLPSVRSARIDHGAGRQATPEEAVARAAMASAPQFARYAGRAPRGVPVAVPVRVIARDAEQQAAVLSFNLLLEVPVEQLVRRLVKDEQDQRARIAAAEAAQAAQAGQVVQPNRGPGTRPAEDAELAALRRRIAELEARNQQLEGQVQLLKDLLTSDRAGPRAPGTQPAR